MVRQIRARLPAAPRPLLLLLAVVAVFGVCWAMVTPPWQSDAAFSHFAYIESLATRAAIPGRANHAELSSDANAADQAIGAHEVEFSSPEAKPSWSAAAADAYRARSAHLSRSDGGGPTPASPYPPLYYASAVPAYLAPIGGDTLDRVNAVQLWGVALLLATVTAAWLLAGEVFGRRRLLQLVAGTVVGLEPMTTFVSTTVSPDALLIPLWTFILWLGTRVIKRGAAVGDVRTFCALTAAAMLTKPTSYVLVPAVALALWLGWRAGDDGRRLEAYELIRAIAIPLLPVIGWVEIERGLHRVVLTASPSTGALTSNPATYILHFLDYVWEFYLPHLPGQFVFHVPRLAALPAPRVLPGLPLWNTWIRGGWGLFGWTDVYMTTWVYGLLAALSGAVAIAGAAIIARFRDRLRWSLTAFYGVTLVSLVAVLHVIEYQQLHAGGDPFIQGRYLLPVISLFGLGAALLVSRLPVRTRGPVVAMVTVGLIALQVLALSTVLRAYYT